MNFKTHNTDVDLLKVYHNGCMPIGLQGELTTTFAKLVELFGEPLRPGMAGSQTDVEWLIQFEDGVIAAIYNWKNGINYLGDDGIAVSDLTEFNIGGPDESVVDRIHEIVITRRGPKVVAPLEPLLYAPGCDARTFNGNLKRFLKDEVGVAVRVSVGNSTRRGITVGDQYVNARLDWDSVQAGTVKWPENFFRLCLLAAYPKLQEEQIVAIEKRGAYGNISDNMITLYARQWEQAARAWMEVKKVPAGWDQVEG